MNKAPVGVVGFDEALEPASLRKLLREIEADLGGFLAQCLVIVTLALTTRYIPRVLERLSGAAAVGIDHVATYIGGAPAAAGGGAAGASGATARVVTGIRGTSPPSRSLSRG